MITKEDIIDVANSINVELTESEIYWILSYYKDAQEQDPSGNWNMVIENLIYQSVEFRDELGYEQTEPGDDDYFDDSEERRDFCNDPDDDTIINMGTEIV